MVSTGATITSSSSKQSELRRLMKLQKERKQQPPVVSSTTTLPPPKSILKQPKQKPRIISALVDYGSDSSEEGLSSLDQPLAAATRNKRIIHSDLPQSLSLPSQEQQQQQQLPTQPVFNADMAAKIQQQEEVQNDAWKEFETTVLRASNANDALVVGTKEKSIPTYSTELSDSEEPDSVIEHELEQAKYEAKMNKLRQLKQRTQTRNTTNEITHNKTSAKSQKRSSPALELLQKRRFKQQRLAASIDDDE